MPNKTYSKEWYDRALHNLEAAKVLLDADHYTDVIGQELQQALEKVLKSLYAYNGEKIPRTHELSLLLKKYENELEIPEGYYDFCDIATTYYTEFRYPTAGYDLPPIDEIRKVSDIANDLFRRVYNIINN